MTDLGLFVTRWYGGTESQEAADEMLSFCDKAGVTEILLGCHEDQSTFDKHFDYLTYIVENKGKKKVIAWVSPTVGRDRENAWTKGQMIQKGLKTIKTPVEQGYKLTLDLDDPDTNDYFTHKISDILNAHPKLDGFYVEGDKLGPIIYMYRQDVAHTAKLITDGCYLYCYGKWSFKPETKEDLLKCLA